MLLYVVRHGDADNQTPDEVRKLTEKGIRTTKRMARLLSASAFPSPAAILASPLVRADETAKIFRQYFAPQAEYDLSAALKPSHDVTRPMALIAGERRESLMIVGHDPLFSLFASALVTGASQPVIEMEKSSIALFEITRMDVLRMRGVLRAYLPPSLALAVED